MNRKLSPRRLLRMSFEWLSSVGWFIFNSCLLRGANFEEEKCFMTFLPFPFLPFFWNSVSTSGPGGGVIILGTRMMGMMCASNKKFNKFTLFYRYNFPLDQSIIEGSVNEQKTFFHLTDIRDFVIHESLELILMVFHQCFDCFWMILNSQSFRYAISHPHNSEVSHVNSLLTLYTPVSLTPGTRTPILIAYWICFIWSVLFVFNIVDTRK